MSRVLPILFNTDMVKAILENRKTVTRRAIKPRQLIGLGCDRCPNNLPEEYIKEKKFLFSPYDHMSDKELINAIYKPPYQLGDVLYIRETWCKSGEYHYRADYETNRDRIFFEAVSDPKWCPSIHMPKEAARIWLKVIDVRVEQLKDITEEQAHKEGYTDDVEYALGHTAAWHFVQDFKNIYPTCTEDSWLWVIELKECEKPESEE